MRVRLGDVCDIINGYAFKSDRYVDSGTRVIRITNVQKGFIEDEKPQYYPIEENDNIQEYMLYENDLLLSLTGNVGRVALLEKKWLPAALNQRVACLRPKDNKILIEYLYFALLSNKFENDCIISAKGIAQKNMSTEWLKKYEISLPEIRVQKKIISICKNLQSIITHRRTQLEKLDLLVKARFVEMFGEPILNEKGWNMVTIRDIVTEVKYGTSKPAVEGGKYPYLRMNNLTYDGHLDLTNLKMIDIPDSEIEKCIVHRGDVLFNRTNSIELVGKTCVFDKDEDMVIAGYIIRVRLKSIMLPIVLSYFMNTDALKKKLRNMAKGAVNQANINAQEFKSINIYLPPIELQTQFADFVKQVDKSRVAVQKELDKAQMLFDSLMQEYFG